MVAYCSHDWLVISNKQSKNKTIDRLLVLPKPDLIELYVALNGAFARKVETDLAHLDEELERVFSEFRQPTKK